MKRHALTLVEILIAITIIGILGLASAQVYRSARNSANERNTAALIQRINSVVMQQVGSYQGRRVKLVALSPTGNRGSGALQKTEGMRELMMFEMPDRSSDFMMFQSGGPPVLRPTVTLDYPPNRGPMLAERYLRKVTGAWDRLKKSGLSVDDANSRIRQNFAAECLYMIVMANPDAAEKFSAKDFGDVDQDGLPEFHDAWGRTIKFLRWAPGFTESKAQTIPTSYDPTNPEDVREAYENRDPFDPQHFDRPTASEPWRGRRLVPLIYSAGPDGVYDINICDDAGQPTYENPPDPYAIPPYASTLIGAPIDTDGDGQNQYDNITNHNL